MQGSPRTWIRWYERHGENVSATCLQFGISAPASTGGWPATGRISARPYVGSRGARSHHALQDGRSGNCWPWRGSPTVTLPGVVSGCARPSVRQTRTGSLRRRSGGCCTCSVPTAPFVESWGHTNASSARARANGSWFLPASRQAIVGEGATGSAARNSCLQTCSHNGCPRGLCVSISSTSCRRRRAHRRLPRGNAPSGCRARRCMSGLRKSWPMKTHASCWRKPYVLSSRRKIMEDGCPYGALQAYQTSTLFVGDGGVEGWCGSGTPNHCGLCRPVSSQ
jgi:hypothetical protein